MMEPTIDHKPSLSQNGSLQGVSHSNPAPSIRRFTSDCAPLNPDGSLPPGISERVTAESYRRFGLRAKKVLLSMGIRLRGEPAAPRLRRALDNPDNRRDRHDHPNPQKHRPAFHYALYIFLKDDSVGRNVYRRIIEPAEHEKNGSTLLDPMEFKQIVRAEFSDRAEPPSVIQPASEAESLSLFALAYALLEKDSSYQILEPLLELGPAFQLFFGAHESPEATVSARQVSQMTEQSEPISNLEEVGKSAAESLHEDQGKASLVTTRSPVATGASPECIAPAAGKRLTAVIKRTTEFDKAQSVRRELGFAAEFDAQSFDKARRAEINAREALIEPPRI